MLFAYDIVFVDETRHGVNSKLEIWRDSSKSKGFRLSRSKTDCMKCKQRINKDGVVKLDGQEIPESYVARTRTRTRTRYGHGHEDTAIFEK